MGSQLARRKGRSQATITCHPPPAAGRQRSDLTVATLSPGAAGGVRTGLSPSSEERGEHRQQGSAGGSPMPAAILLLPLRTGHPRKGAAGGRGPNPTTASKEPTEMFLQGAKPQPAAQPARAAQAASASLPQPGSAALTHTLLPHARRDSPRSERAHRRVSRIPRTRLHQGSCSLLQQVSACRCRGTHRQDPELATEGLGADREANGSSHPRAHCPEQGGAAAPSCAGQQRRAQQMPGQQQEGPRMAPRATRAPRGHAAVPPLCPARVICVTATTSLLRSSRSLMLMTVNMKQRP